MKQTRIIKIADANMAEAIKKNVFAALLEDHDYAVTTEESGIVSIAYDLSSLEEYGYKVIEYLLIQYAKLGFFGETPETIEAAIQPALNPATTNDCLFYVAQNPASMKKFTDEVMKFSGISLNNAIEVKFPVNLKALQLTRPAVILTEITPQQRGAIKSSSAFKKWGMAGGKIINNVTSGAGLMAHTIVEEALAPSAINLGIAGSKIMKSAIVSGARIADVVVDEGTQAILEVANVIDNAEGFSKAKERVVEAWGIIAKKRPNDDDFISF